MYRMLQLAAAVLLGSAVFVLGAERALAVEATPHFEPLSADHTNWGVSQFNYLNLPAVQDDFPVLMLRNPNKVRQAVATLIYGRAGGGEAGFPETEVYLGCRVDVLTPHDSLGVTGATLPPAPLGPWARYAEIIAAPVALVPITERSGLIRLGRMADGLGIVASRARSNPPSLDAANLLPGITWENPGFLAFPNMFTLPSDDVVEGQRADAIICICTQVNDLGLDPPTFKKFGINCPVDPPLL